MGHFRRPRERPEIRVRQIGCGPAVFLHQQSRLAAELQVDVVPRDPQVLPADPRSSSRMQERPAVHVPR